MQTKRSWIPALLAVAAATLPAMAGTIILHADSVSFDKAFVCGEAKSMPAGRYTIEVTYEPTPTAHSVLQLMKGGKALCDIAGSPTKLNDEMAASKVRFFTRVDNDRKAIEAILITPSEMRDKVKNQVFYIPLAAAK